MNLNKTLQRGFTLVELLIVTIILAILAAIVIPQFASTTDDAKLSALDANLSAFRASIDLYYQQHGSYPSANKSSGSTTCPNTGAAGTGAADDSQAFIDQLSRYSNAVGETCTTTDGIFKYGPYMKKDSMPKNAITDSAALLVIKDGKLGMGGEATPAGWKFDNVTGQFIANDQTDNNDER